MYSPSCSTVYTVPPSVAMTSPCASRDRAVRRVEPGEVVAAQRADAPQLDGARRRAVPFRRPVAVGAAGNPVQDDGLGTRRTQPGDERIACRPRDKRGYDRECGVTRRADRRMQVEVPTHGTARIEEGRGGGDQFVGAGRFERVHEVVARGAEHAVQVRVDEAPAGRDRVDVGHAQHEVDRQLARRPRQRVQYAGDHLDRPRFVAVHADRQQDAGPARVRLGRSDRQYAARRRGHHETGGGEGRGERAYVARGQRAQRRRQGVERRRRHGRSSDRPGGSTAGTARSGVSIDATGQAQ